VTAGHTLVYNLPGSYDAEGHFIYFSMSPADISTWISLTSTSLTISPTITQSGLSYPLTITLSDTITPTAYTMAVTVIPNTPPTFISTPIAQTVYPGQVKSYSLPGTSDIDGDIITVELLVGGPSFVTYTSSTNQLNINPVIT